MNASEFIKLYIDLGFNILKTSSLNWLINEEGYAHSFPTLDIVFPTENDFKEVFNSKMKFILFRTKISKCNTFEYLFEGNKYEMENFDSKIRNQIKKGLKSCEIKDANLESLIIKGLEINRQTLRRQKRSISYLQDEYLWKDYISKFFNKEDIYIKGAYINSELTGYMIIIKVYNKYVIQHPFRDEKFSSSNPMNAILYSFINEIILREGKITITYGLASFSDKPGLDKFKKGMLFKELPTSRLAVINPKYNFFFNNLTHKFINLISRLNIIKSNKFGILSYLSDATNLYLSHYKNKDNDITKI